jgi:hypothetical protein
MLTLLTRYKRRRSNHRGLNTGHYAGQWENISFIFFPPLPKIYTANTAKYSEIQRFAVPIFGSQTKKMKGFSRHIGHQKMPSRVSEFSLATTVYARVQLPSFINLKPDESGITWWVKWSTLYYTENGEIKEYDLGNLDYEGDYKRPEVEDEEVEEYEEEVPEDIEEALEAWEEYQKNDEEKSDDWIKAMEHKIALYHEHLADVARGK